MTKNRSEIEESEKIICEYLYDSPSHIRRSSKLEGVIAKKLSEKLNSEIVNAIHIGNSYDSIGDIKIETETGLEYCELKMLTTPGSGTEFNISTSTLTSVDLFAEPTMGWREYMEQVGHGETVHNLLDSFEHYPEDIHNDYNTELQKRKKLGRYIRDLVKNANFDPLEDEKPENVDEEKYKEVKQAAEIKQNIMSFDREVKKNYLNYLSDKELNPEKVKALTLVLAGGYHKKKQIFEYMEVIDEVSEMVNGVGHVFDDYRVFYAYTDPDENAEEVILEKGQQEKVIDALSKKTDWDIMFTDDTENDTTSFIIGFHEDNEFNTVYRLSLHWGNVFQGIATPRLNGFKSKFFKNF